MSLRNRRKIFSSRISASSSRSKPFFVPEMTTYAERWCVYGQTRMKAEPQQVPTEVGNPGGGLFEWVPQFPPGFRVGPVDGLANRFPGGPQVNRFALLSAVPGG